MPNKITPADSVTAAAELFVSDMLHIAVAPVVWVYVLVSWNYKHIARFDKIWSRGEIGDVPRINGFWILTDLRQSDF